MRLTPLPALLATWIALVLAPTPAASAAEANSPTSGSVGAIVGRVLSGATGSYLSNARVTVQGTNRETVTDENGDYRLFNLPLGPVRLRVSYLGLKDKVETVNVLPAQTVQRDVELFQTGAEDVVKMGEFTVVETREMSAQTLAFNEQRQAPNIKNVVAFDEYPTGYTDSLTYFLRFIPGVTPSGVGASVRALPTDMGQITIDGAEVTAVYSGQTRGASLVTFPVNNVSRIEVTKVPTPDMPASLGGSINVISKSGFERKSPQFTYNLYSAFQPDLGVSLRRNHGGLPGNNSRHVLPSLDFSYLRPINQSLSFSVSASKRENYTHAPGTNTSWDLVNLRLPAVTSNWVTNRIATKSGRVGVDWKLGSRHVFNSSLQYMAKDSTTLDQGMVVNFGTITASGPTFTEGRFPNGNGSVTQNNNTALTIRSNTLFGMLRYKFLGENWKVDASASHSKSRSAYGNVQEGFFSSVGASIASLGIRGDGIGAGGGMDATRPATYTFRNLAGATVDPLDGSLLTLNTAAQNLANFQSQKTEFRLDVRRDWHAAMPFSLKAGFFLQPAKSTGGNPGSITYNFRPTATAADRLASQYDLVDPVNSLNGESFNGSGVRWLSPVRVYELFRSRPEFFVADAPTVYTNLVNNSKKLQETISATYLRGDLKLMQNRLWLVGGVRYERTEDEGWGPLNDPSAQYQKDARGNIVDGNPAAAGIQPVFLTNDLLARAQLRYKERGSHTERHYDGFYPSLNATFSIRDDLVARFGFARTIGRPPLAQIIPGVTMPDPSSSSRTITVINSGLKPWTADNFDLSLESYLFKNGKGTIGVFQKDLTGFFVSTLSPATAEDLVLYGIPESDLALGYDISTRVNGGDARLRGIELSYQQALTFLPRWARGLQVFGNWTRRTVTGPSLGDFSNFSPSSLSWGVNFTRARFAAKLNCTKMPELRGNPVAASATIPAGVYQWTRANTSYSASVEYSVTKRFRLYATLQDFNGSNTALGLTQYNADTPEYARSRTYIVNPRKAVLGLKGEF
jgi:iron complex outermembrane receptor protein